MHIKQQLQSFLTNISSQVIFIFHVLPCNALVGHLSTQILQLPHFGFIGETLLIVIKGAVVITFPRTIEHPN